MVSHSEVIGRFERDLGPLQRRSAMPRRRHHRQWPKLNPAAYWGIFGDIIESIEPFTEADPAAMLATLIAYTGHACGPRSYARAEGAMHPPSEFFLIVGKSAVSRKGTSEARIRQFFDKVMPEWTSDQLIHGGLSSGEGLIALVRDPDDETGQKTRPRCIFESEFGRTLRAISREGATLAPVIQQAWDGKQLNTLTKNVMRTGPAFVTVLGHIVEEELMRRLQQTDAISGFGNRFLYVLATRSKSLPEGDQDPDVGELDTELRVAIEAAKSGGVLKRTPAASEQWHDVYDDLLDEDRAGLFGAVTSRATPHVLRLASIIALANKSQVIDVAHQSAALAFWKYSEDSSRYIFAEFSGDRVADEILRALMQYGELSNTEISERFKRNQPAAKLSDSKTLLVDQGLAVWGESEGTDGRTIQILKLAEGSS